MAGTTTTIVGACCGPPLFRVEPAFLKAPSRLYGTLSLPPLLENLQLY
jgi:hypothetical protein